MLYFPYVLLLLAITLVLIEWTFVRLFKAKNEIDSFYNLLVNEAIIDKPINDPVTKTPQTKTQMSKLAFEISQSLGNSTNFYLCYLTRNILEIVVALALLIVLVIFGLPAIQNEQFIFCDVGTFWYHCAGHAPQFYFFVLIATLILISLYILASVYSFLWMIVPQLGSMSYFMNKHCSNLDFTDDLTNVYFQNRDLKLLLDLLAVNMGNY